MTSRRVNPGTATTALPAGQRVVLVLPSNGEFDSRTYRIATTLIARGHSVVVLARLTGGLPADEMHPAGYRIIRLDVKAIDGLPFARQIARRRRALGRRRSGGAVAPAPSVRSAPAENVPAAGRSNPPTGAPPRTALVGTSLRRVLKAGVRRFAIPLTIRAHTRLALDVAPQADLYHGMAYMGIPVALALGRRHGAPVVYDARDIYLEARNMARARGVARWLFAAAERRWARNASRVITVNEDYADVLATRLRVPRPLVVMNCSFRFTPPEPRERRFHALLDLDPATKVVLYHGGLFPDRGIEQLIAAIPDVPGATLVLMGYGALADELAKQAEDPALAGRVRLVPPVPPDELHAWVACADVVAMPIQPSTLNHRLTTPNKLFEAMAAGVPVLASDLPGMGRIVREMGCGVLCDGTDASSVAAGLCEVLADPERAREMGRRGHAAAEATYNWDRQATILLREYGRLTGNEW